MKKILLHIFTLLVGGIFTAIPFAVQASEIVGGGFAPSSNDLSIYILSMIFGVVDGVLHGSGSQIMGQLFSVFNAAVLFVAGIIFAFIIGKGVVDTAQEGEFLGRRKSSLMIPVRVAVATALLIPKASGYCVLQIAVMWLVVQGAGVADHIWSAALNYIQRGGQIVSQPVSTQEDNSSINGKVDLAAKLLAGQICMLSLEKMINLTSQQYTATTNAGSPIFFKNGQPQLPPPDFLSTVNISALQVPSRGQQPITVDFPNFDNDSDYSLLNGICGTLKIQTYNKYRGSAQFRRNPSLINQMNIARLVATQQMYMSLVSVARLITNNIMQHLSAPAQAQYLGRMVNGRWAVPAGKTGAPLLNGNELYIAAIDYMGVIQPNLRLLSLSAQDVNSQNKFIDDAKKNGWLMAGTYYFNLAKINQSSPVVHKEDANSVTFSITTSDGKLSQQLRYSDIITQLKNTLARRYQVPVNYFIGGITLGTADDPSAGVKVDLQQLLQKLFPASPSTRDVYAAGLNVATYIDSAQQNWQQLAGITKPAYTRFQTNYSAKIGATPAINTPRFNCSWNGDPLSFGNAALGFKCLLAGIVNTFLGFISTALNAVALVFGQFFAKMSELSGQWMNTLQTNFTSLQQDPLIVLMNLGQTFINHTAQAWMILVASIAALGAIPMVNASAVALALMVMPIVAPIMGAFMMSGILFAFYIPMLPFILYTFGVLGWLIAVIEAMVAGPLIAFGILYPEGHESWGKAEPSILLLLNVFLRPAMMVVGFIVGIGLSFAGLILLNLGFSKVAGVIILMESDFAGAIAPMIILIIYLMMTMQIVSKSFSLIHILPDKVLRFIGGNAESFGSETSEMATETKGAISATGQTISRAGGGAAREIIQRTKRAPKKKKKKKEEDDEEENTGNVSLETAFNSAAGADTDELQVGTKGAPAARKTPKSAPRPPLSPDSEED